MEAAFGHPHYQIHRADLLSALANALPVERLHCGHCLIGLADVEHGVEARFSNGQRVQFDVLVGADGIHSTTRGLLFGPEAPRFTGCSAFTGWSQPTGCAI